MSNPTQAPQRSSGPHAPLPNASVAAAVSAALPDEPPRPAPPVTAGEEDPRARAARRAEQLREHGSDEGTDEYYIDPKIIPDGWSYEYKRFTVYGEQDPSYQVSLAQAGWEAVPASRHPELMPVGYQGNTIMRRGQILMERPLVITEDARLKEKQKARDQVRGKEQQLGAAPAGTFERANKDAPLAEVKKTYEAIPIPE